MSQATKRKHVVKEVLEDYVVPSPQQQIVRVREGAALLSWAPLEAWGFSLSSQCGVRVASGEHLGMYHLSNSLPSHHMSTMLQ